MLCLHGLKPMLPNYFSTYSAFFRKRSTTRCSASFCAASRVSWQRTGWTTGGNNNTITQWSGYNYGVDPTLNSSTGTRSAGLSVQTFLCMEPKGA